MLLFIDISLFTFAIYPSFNTSHVTLYHADGMTVNDLVKFQYITCYSLSIPEAGNIQLLCTFQYITCYSLSFKRKSVGLNPDSFQYITCYSLSQTRSWKAVLRKVSIHHMLLFIESIAACVMASMPVSIHHMLLFISEVTRAKAAEEVSIHHMLLFISQDRMRVRYITSFNTSHVTLYPSFYRVFIHPHV